MFSPFEVAMTQILRIKETFRSLDLENKGFVIILLFLVYHLSSMLQIEVTDATLALKKSLFDANTSKIVIGNRALFVISAEDSML
jgi:hypothetical protein